MLYPYRTGMVAGAFILASLVKAFNVVEVQPIHRLALLTRVIVGTWGEITKRLGKSENLLILKKPFDSAEVAQLASALTEKWNLARKASMKLEELEQLVKERAKELIETNNQLKWKSPKESRWSLNSLE